MTIQEAILQEDRNALQQILLENPSLIEEMDEHGIPMSFLAAGTGSLPIVKYIVEYSRASMNTVDSQHRNILHFAAMSGNLELVRYLVEKVGMSPIAGDINLETPFQISHQKGYQAIEDYFASVTGFTLQQAYCNPIRTGMFPDPSIVRVGEDYYMVNSSFIYFPCIPISHSRDLIHWRIIGYAITNPEWADLDELEGGRGYWAPDISYYKGRFYIAATYRLNDTGTIYRRQMVVSSQQPQGPYSKPVFLEEDGIDPSIFNDEDGRRYMLLNRGARIFELNETATKQISEARLLFYGDQKRAPEGPHLLKKDGFYYLFEAEGGTGPGHRITVSRSRTLLGNYEPCPYNPIMRQQDPDAPIQRCGHGKPVCTQNGEWYMVYLCGRMIGDGYSILGRETALDPITWTPDGWPIVNGLRGPSVLQKRPQLPIQPQMLEPGLIEKGSLSCEWVTPRPPMKDGIVVQGDAVWLRGSRLPLSEVGARNILLRRQKHFCFYAETMLEVPELKEGQETGLICYYDENTWVSWGICKTQEGYTLSVTEHIGQENKIHQCKNGTVLPKSLKLSVETRYLQRKFTYELIPDLSYSTTGSHDKKLSEADVHADIRNSIFLEHVNYLCDEGFSYGKRFTGAMVGIYAFAGEQELKVKFLEFQYRMLQGRL